MSDTNSTEDQLCLKPHVRTATTGYRNYAITYVIVNALVITVSLFIWIKWRRKSSYLHSRSLSMTLLLTLGFICNIFTGSLTRVSEDEESVLNGCFIAVFSFFMVVPCLILAEAIRVLLFLNRYKYNKKLSESFKVSDFGESSLSISEASSQLGDFKKLSEEKFGIKLGILGLVSTLILALIFTARSCPDFGKSNDCRLDSFAGDLIFTLIFDAIALFALVFVYYVHQKVKTYPDPFRILHEIRTGMTICLLITFPSMILTALDVGNFVDSDPHRFDFALTFDLGILVLFYYSVPFQLYIGSKPVEKRAGTDDLGLEKVLEDQIGVSLFRQHLITEFSVENLNFVEAVSIYRKLFHGNATRAQIVTSATRIFRTFIAPNAPSLLNIGSSTSSEVRERFESGEIYEDLFNSPYFEILELMEQDSFLRFRLTEDYKTYIGANKLTNIL